eukprot:2462854-Pleurochrysis_carterae.AAC.2
MSTPPSLWIPCLYFARPNILGKFAAACLLRFAGLTVRRAAKQLQRMGVSALPLHEVRGARGGGRRAGRKGERGGNR